MKAPRSSRPLPRWVGPLCIGGAFVTLVALETWRPLREKKHESRLLRNARNLGVALCSAAAVQLTDTPVTSRLTRIVERRQIGVIKRLKLPTWLETTAALLLLDYSLYLWHVAFHKVPTLWRLHKVHHVDLDMDTSTGIRFHAVEMMLSVFLRVGQILIIGVSPFAFSIWNVWLLCEVMFHHSNFELPPRVERWLGRIIVTPRLHGVHHSVEQRKLNSNWSSGLTIWDWLHGTLHKPNEDELRLGVAGHLRPEDVTFPKVMSLPFVEPPHPTPRDASRSLDE